MREAAEMRHRRRAWRAAGALCLAGALACMAVACAAQGAQGQAQDEYGKLAAQTAVSPVPVRTPGQTPEPAGEATPEPTADPLAALREKGVPIPEKAVDFADLQKNTNADIYAWIYIPDTKVDYPVLQHPADNSYYLDYNLDGTKGYPGCIYTENYNGKDFTDPVTVVYGHNMKNGSMFAGLHRYSDPEYMEEHPYIYIYTEDGLLVYEVFAAVEYSDVHLLYNRDYTDTVQFEGYLESIREVRDMNSVVREGVEVSAGDRVLTLSTCVNPRPDKRFLVQGVLLDGE